MNEQSANELFDDNAADDAWNEPIFSAQDAAQWPAPPSTSLWVAEVLFDGRVLVKN